MARRKTDTDIEEDLDTKALETETIEEVKADAPKKGFTRFETGLLTISHLSNVFQAKDGFIDLPSGAAWYKPLVDSGQLKPIN